MDRVQNEEELINYLERLVLIKFEHDERRRILEEVRKIIEFFRALEEIKNLDEYEPLFHVHDISGPTRDDEPRSDDLVTTEELSINAVVENGYIKAPKTLIE